MNLKPDINNINGIVEPNGVGKATTLKSLSSLVRPTSGNIYTKGMDISTDTVEIHTIVPSLEKIFLELMGVELFVD